MKFIVTGSSGLLGSEVVRILQATTDFEIVCIDLVEAHDVLDSGTMESALRGADAVIHLAGPSSSILFGDSPKAAWDATVQPIAWLLTNFSGRVVIPSSGTVYGELGFACSEGQALPCIGSTYAQAKRECERLALYGNSIGADFKVCRVFTGYGADESSKGVYASPPYSFTIAALQGSEIIVYGDGHQQRDFVYSSDVARALIAAAISKGPHPIYNIGSGTSISFLELLDAIAAATGVAIDVSFTGAPADYIGSTQGDFSLARDELQWEPRVGLEEGLLSIISSYNTF